MSLTVKTCLLAFVALISAVLASNNLKFELMESNSFDHLRLKVTFPDNREDAMKLERFYLNTAEKLERVEKCRFVGHLESNHKSSIALTGCVGTEDVLITILSSNPMIQKMFLWKMDGEVEELKEDFEDLMRDDDEDEPDNEVDIETPDSIIDKKHCALELEGNIVGLISPELTLEVTVGYEDNFLASYAGDHDEAVATIEATLTHAQAFFYAESLQTRITLRTNGDITYWPDQRMTAKGNFMKQFANLLRANADSVPDADSHVLFTCHGLLNVLGVAPDDLPPVDKVAGMASFGNVCAGNYGSRTIVERGKGGTGMGMIGILLHELGHNLGMGHNGEYEKKIEGIPAGLCKIDKTGDRRPIMRYASDDWVPRDLTWTICNRCDLLRNFHKKLIKSGEYCLDKP